jgi:hypothetical protein
VNQVANTTVIDANVVLCILAACFVVHSVMVYALIKLLLTRRTFWETDELTRRVKQREGIEHGLEDQLTAEALPAFSLRGADVRPHAVRTTGVPGV